MIYGYFREFIASILEFFDHLEADRAGVAFKRYVIKNIAADKPKVAVNISQFETKRDFDDVVVDSANQYAVPGVIAANFVAIDDVNIIV